MWFLVIAALALVPQAGVLVLIVVGLVLACGVLGVGAGIGVEALKETGKRRR